MVEIGFYEASAQIIAVLILAEIARAALMVGPRDRLLDLDRQLEDLSTTYERLKREGVAADELRGEVQSRMRDAEERSIADTASLEALRADLDNSAKRLDPLIEEVNESAKSVAESRETLKARIKTARRDGAIGSLGMSLVMIAEIAGLLVSLAVIADPALNNASSLQWTITALGVGIAGITLQVLFPQRVSAAETRLEKFANASQLIVFTAAFVGAAALLYVLRN